MPDAGAAPHHCNQGETRSFQLWALRLVSTGHSGIRQPYEDPESRRALLKETPLRSRERSYMLRARGNSDSEAASAAPLP